MLAHQHAHARETPTALDDALSRAVAANLLRASHLKVRSG
jgi:hypothetical protein